MDIDQKVSGFVSAIRGYPSIFRQPRESVQKSFEAHGKTLVPDCKPHRFRGAGGLLNVGISRVTAEGGSCSTGDHSSRSAELDFGKFLIFIGLAVEGFVRKPLQAHSLPGIRTR